MPGKHKNSTISFRPSEQERQLIEKRAELSGLHKKDFIIRCCIYSRIVVVGKKETVQKIVDELEEMQSVMKDIAGELKDGNFSLSQEAFQEMKQEYLALAAAVVDIVNGAAYLFGKTKPEEEN